MLGQLFLVYVLVLFATISYANEANWNCSQDSKTKEWVCVGIADQSASSPKAEPQPSETKPEPEYRQDEGIVDSETRENNEATKPKEQTSAIPAQAIKPDIRDDEPAESQAIAPENRSGAEVKPRSEAVSEAPPPVFPASQKPVPASKKPGVLAPSGKQQGWNCDAKSADDKWNCELVGADPKGEARVIAAEEEEGGIFDPTFNNKEERTFSSLRNRFKENPWGNCTIQLGKRKYFISDKKKRDFADVDMDSNAAEIYDNEVGNYRGNVEIRRADQQASSNAANYDSVSEALDLHGNVFYSENDLSLYTESANLKLASDEARLRDTLFISATTPIRGRASAVYRDSDTFSRYKDAIYTSCEPGNQDWMIHATDLKMNKKSGEGSAKNAWLEFKGVPVFYTPYMNFPIDSRRKTGLLAPDFGNTGRGGFRFGMPFYWNIAPNYDATLKPRYYTERGFMFAGDFRYLTEITKGSVSAEFLPSDEVKDVDASTLNKKDVFVNKDRYLLNFNNHTRFTPELSTNADLNIVSDKQYFNDLGNALNFPTFSNIRSYADVTYVDQGINFNGIVETFRVIDPNITRRLKPYRRLPQLNLDFNHTFDSVPANVGLENEFAYFLHSDVDVPDGQRFNVKPYVSFPLKTASAYITPKISLQYTQYLLNNQGVGNPASVSRIVPIGSIDTGVNLEKNLEIAGDSYLHTIEPRLFYLYIPRVNQDDIPIFDTQLYDFQYDSLFRENRYSGNDRIQDANQLGLGISSRLVDSETGLEKLKLNIGQIFYFQDRKVTGPMVRLLNPRTNTLLDNAVQTSFFSPLVAELSGQINRHLSFQTGLQWDPDINEIIRGNASLHLQGDPGEILNVGYTYRQNNLNKDALDQVLADPTLTNEADRKFYNLLRNDPKISPLVVRGGNIIQSDISFRWPLYDNWSAFGGWQYSLLFNQSQDAFLGFEKETCCWRFSVMGRRYVNNSFRAVNQNPAVQNQQYESQLGIFFQIEFKGFTGLGNADLGEFLQKSIFGYRKKSF